MFLKVVKEAWKSFLIYPFYALAAWLVVFFLAWPLCWLVSLVSIITGKDTVDGFLSYLTTANATLDGGYKQKVGGYKDPKTLNKWQLWWQRTCWVARNPAYKFKAVVLGFKGKVLWKEGPWYVLQSESGMKYFGYHGEDDFPWLGWTDSERGGYHQLKWF